jgi:hypothetical protein
MDGDGNDGSEGGYGSASGMPSGGPAAAASSFSGLAGAQPGVHGVGGLAGLVGGQGRDTYGPAVYGPGSGYQPGNAWGLPSGGPAAAGDPRAYQGQASGYALDPHGGSFAASWLGVDPRAQYSAGYYTPATPAESAGPSFLQREAQRGLALAGPAGAAIGAVPQILSHDPNTQVQGLGIGMGGLLGPAGLAVAVGGPALTRGLEAVLGRTNVVPVGADPSNPASHLNLDQNPNPAPVATGPDNPNTGANITHPGAGMSTSDYLSQIFAANTGVPPAMHEAIQQALYGQGAQGAQGADAQQAQQAQQAAAVPPSALLGTGYLYQPRL